MEEALLRNATLSSYFWLVKLALVASKVQISLNKATLSLQKHRPVDRAKTWFNL